MNTKLLHTMIYILIVASMMGCAAQPGAAVTPQPVQITPAPTDTLPIYATATEPAEPTGTASSTQTQGLLPPLDVPAPREVSAILAALEDLPIETFFEESYKQLLLRSPETITELGLSAALGLRDNQLDDLSDAFVRDTQALETGILSMLQRYDRSSLPPDVQVSYDVYVWYLDNQVRGHKFLYHNYPLHHFLGSWHSDLQSLLTEIHPLATPQNAEDYIDRLMQVDDQAAQLQDGLEKRASLGIIPPIFILQMARRNLLADLQVSDANRSAVQPEKLAVYTRFQEALDSIEGLSVGEKQALRKAALSEIENAFVPAFFSLVDYLDQLIPLANQDAGVWKLPDGEAYYAHRLRTETSTDLTPAEVHEIGLREVARIQAEMRAAFAELGYPQDEDLGSLMGRAVQAGGFYNSRSAADKRRVVAAYERLLADMQIRLEEVFAQSPKAEVIVKGAPFGGGGFYISGSIDGKRPGVFYAGLGEAVMPKFNMPTIAYHEAIPGHHFQMALAQEADLPLFRNALFFNGYSEGWAVYSERLAWEMGLYTNQPYANIGRLQLELLRAARLAADTGIHAMGWTREEANRYMAENLGDSSGQWASEVDRYIVLPGQATGYLIGMLEILELRQFAREELGDRFELKAFHTLVIGNGGLPLQTLKQLVEDYVDQQKP